MLDRREEEEENAGMVENKTPNLEARPQSSSDQLAVLINDFAATHESEHSQSILFDKIARVCADICSILENNPKQVTETDIYLITWLLSELPSNVDPNNASLGDSLIKRDKLFELMKYIHSLPSAT